MIIKDVHRNKLHNELLAKDINLIGVFAIDDTDYGAEINFDDGTDMTLVQSVLDTHDPTPIPTINPEDVLNAKIEVQTINTLIDLGVI